MKSYILLENSHEHDLPEEFRDDDVRYSEGLVEYFLQAFTQPGDVVFDPFAGFGTTLFMAEKMGRAAYGIEFDEHRAAYIRSKLRHPERLIHGDARQLLRYALPVCDFSMTSPPYMTRDDTANPFTAYTTSGTGYAAYLSDLRQIYAQMKQVMKTDARVVIEAANLKGEHEITTLAWDIAREVSQELDFEGEVIVGWDRYGFGYEHSYCLMYTHKGGRYANQNSCRG